MDPPSTFLSVICTRVRCSITFWACEVEHSQGYYLCGNRNIVMIEFHTVPSLSSDNRYACECYFSILALVISQLFLWACYEEMELRRVKLTSARRKFQLSSYCSQNYVLFYVKCSVFFSIVFRFVSEIALLLMNLRNWVQVKERLTIFSLHHNGY